MTRKQSRYLGGPVTETSAPVATWKKGDTNPNPLILQENVSYTDNDNSFLFYPVAPISAICSMNGIIDSKAASIIGPIIKGVMNIPPTAVTRPVNGAQRLDIAIIHKGIQKIMPVASSHQNLA